MSEQTDNAAIADRLEAQATKLDEQSAGWTLIAVNGVVVDDMLGRGLQKDSATLMREAAVRLRARPMDHAALREKLLRRYLDNHCQAADQEGMSTLCECRLCLDTRALLADPAPPPAETGKQAHTEAMTPRENKS